MRGATWLRLQLLLPALAVLPLVLGVWMLVRDREAGLQARILGWAEADVRADLHRAQSALEDALAREDLAEVQALIRGEALDARVDLVVLLDESLRVRLTTSSGLEGRPPEALPGVDPARARQALAAYRIGWFMDGNGHGAAYLPVRLSPDPGELRARRVGVLVKTVDYSRDLAAGLAEARQSGTRTLAAGVLFAVILAVALHTMITRRIRRLLEAAGQVAQGTLGVRSGVDGHDELGDLGRAFDSMVARLEDQRSTLVAELQARERLQGALDAQIRELSEFRFAMDQGAIIAITDAAGTITHVNDAFVAISRYPREELLGKNHRILKGTAHPPAFYKGLWRTISRGQVWKGEIQNRAKDGTPYWVDTAIIPFLGPEGRPVRYLAVRFDITDKKRLEQEGIRITEERRALLEAASVGHLVPFRRAAPGGELELGGAVQPVLGVSPAEVRRHPGFLETLLDREGIAQFRGALRGPEGQVHSFLAKRAGAPGLQWLRWTVQREGEMVRGVIQDVTEQQELEDRFQQSQRLESLGTLASGISHDFNNLLTALVGSLDLLGRDRSLSEGNRARLATMGKAVARGRILVQQLSAFGRRSSPAWVLTDLNQVAREVRDLIQPALPPGVTLELKLDSQGLRGFLDPTQLHQALTNLLLNARDALGGRGHICLRSGTLRLEDARRLKGRSPGSYFLLEVVDDGPGIPEDLHTRIFEPFFTTKPVGKGTGLGLAVVFGVVERHRGLLELDSAPGQGTTFRVLLPALDRDQTMPFTGAFQPGAPTVALALPPGPDRDALESILTSLGHAVQVLDGVKNAMAGGEPPSGIVCAPERIPFLLPWLVEGAPWQGVPWCLLGDPLEGAELKPPPRAVLPSPPQVIDVLKVLGHF